jgi:hypothetical protein
MGHWVLKYWEYLLGTEVQEVNCSVCFGFRSKRWPNNGADRRVQGRGAQITVPTSPSSVITAAQSYPSGFESQQVMSLSRKVLWTRPWKTHWIHQSIRCCRLVMTKESSPMMMTHTGNTSSLQCQEVGRRKGSKELVVIWVWSVDLVWLFWFVRKRFVNEIIMIIIKNLKKLDYQRAW